MEQRLTTPRFGCLIIDDEESAHTALRDLIEAAPWLYFAGSCYSALEAIEKMAQQDFDILFLDVRMPDLSGLDLLRVLSFPRPHVILTTGFREYAYDGYQHEVTDFLLKPISPPQFIRVISKLLKIPSQKDFLPVLKPSLQSPVDTPEISDSEQDCPKGLVWFKVTGKNIPLRFDQIYYVQALKDYVKIHYNQGVLVVYGNLASMTQILPADQFHRLNRSYIINRYAIQEIEGNMVKMPDGFTAMIPQRSRRNEVIRLLTR